MEDARWLAPIVTDQSAFAGYYGQYYSGCLHFSRTFFPGSHFRLGRPGIQGQLYFPESLKYETHICQLQVIGERHAKGTRSWYAFRLRDYSHYPFSHRRPKIIGVDWKTWSLEQQASVYAVALPRLLNKESPRENCLNQTRDRKQNCKSSLKTWSQTNCFNYNRIGT